MVRKTTGDKAEQRLRERIRKCVENGTGCNHCSTGRCLAKFVGREGDVMQARVDFRSQDSSVQDMQIMLMFSGRGALEEKTNIISHLPDRCETSDSEECQNHEVTRQASAMNYTSDEEVDGAPECVATSDEDKDRWQVGNDDATDSDQGRDHDANTLGPHAKKRRYRQQRRATFTCMFIGLSVCKAAATSLLGVSKNMVERIVNGGRDLRKGPRPKGKWGESLKMRKDGVFHMILGFLFQLYNSCAEGLPNKLKFMKSEEAGICIGNATEHSRAKRRRARANNFEETSDEELQYHIIEDSSDEERLLHGTALYMSQPRTVDAMLHTDKLPRRYLPHGRPIHLWWQFVQVARKSAAKVPSYHSFLRVMHRVFDTKGGFLKFRKSGGDHAKCTACECYKKELKIAKSLTERESIMKDALA
jgi:hypothetical protein